jgi:hypothetical protein
MLHETDLDQEEIAIEVWLFLVSEWKKTEF